MIVVLFWPSEKETAHKTSQTNDSKAFRCLYKAFWSTLEVPDRKLVALAFCSYPIGHVQCLMFSHMLMLGNHLGFVRTR